MVNNKIDCYPNSNNEVSQLKESRFQIKSTQSDRTTAKLVEKNADTKVDQSQLSSIENTLNDRTKLLLSDDLKLYEYLGCKNDELVGGQPVLSNSLSSFLANEMVSNENQPNENQFLNCGANLDDELSSTNLIDEFENSIEISESDCDNQLKNLSSSTFNSTNSLQIDPFLSLLPYHYLSNDNKTLTKLNQLQQQQQPLLSSNLTTNITSSSSIQQQDVCSVTTNQSLTNFTKLIADSKSFTNKPSNGQTDLFQSQFNSHSSRSNSPLDNYIKLDNDQIKCQSMNSSTTMSSSSIESIDPIINEKRSLSSQKLNGEDLLFSLVTSEDLNEVANYFTDLPKEKFNCSPSLDSLNSGDSMFCSSVFDSPPPSSTSSLNNDLPFILSSDHSTDLSSKQTSDQSFLDSEFPFLSDDSIFDSFINSNLSDLINADEFFNEKCTLNDDLQFENNNLNELLNGFTSCFQSDHSSLPKTRKPLCTLSKDSNLARLLKEKLPIKPPSQSNQSATSNRVTNNVNNIINLNNQAKTDHHFKNGLTKQSEQQCTSSRSSNVNSTTPTTTIVNNNSSNNTKTISSNHTSSNNSNNEVKKNGLITRKFTIQSVNVNTNGEKVSTGCLARSIKIIDPVSVGNCTNGVKYLVNTSNGTAQTTTTTNGISLNLTPANCLTVTTNGSSRVNQSQLNGTTTANMSTAKSFIIKSVDGKFANGILYTPISKNGQTNVYTSNLTANSLTTTVNALALANSTVTGNNQGGEKVTTTKIRQPLMAAFTPNSLFINNRKLVQKRPYSSMSVSISNNNNTTQTTSPAKDFYSIDFVPKQPFTTTTTFTETLCSSNDLNSEIKKKFKTLDNQASTTNTKNYSSKLPTNSVLLNLLLNGEDVSNGYLKSNYTYKRCNQSIYKSQQSTTRIA